jgi:hypothetical protein
MVWGLVNGMHVSCCLWEKELHVSWRVDALGRWAVYVMARATAQENDSAT